MRAHQGGSSPGGVLPRALPAQSLSKLTAVGCMPPKTSKIIGVTTLPFLWAPTYFDVVAARAPTAAAPRI